MLRYFSLLFTIIGFVACQSSVEVEQLLASDNSASSEPNTSSPNNDSSVNKPSDKNSEKEKTPVARKKGSNGQTNTGLLLQEPEDTLFNKNMLKFGTGAYYSQDIAADPRVLKIVDFNSDGKLDLITSSFNGNRVTTSVGDGFGFLNANDIIDGGMFNPLDAIAGNLDGDAQLDIVVLDTANVKPFVDDNAGAYVNIANSRGAQQVIAVADVMGSSDMDIITLANDPVDVWVYMNNGNASFSLFPSATSQNLFSGVVFNSMQVANFTNDNIPDIILANNDDGAGNEIALLIGDGDGTYDANSPILFDSGAGDATRLIVFNAGDDANTSDIAFIRGSDNVTVGLSDGNGSFAFSDIDLNSNGTATDISAVDFDGDTDLDILASVQNDNVVEVLINNGSGSFSAGTPISTLSSPLPIAAGLLDNDTIGDFVVASQTNNELLIQYGNGDGTAQTASLLNNGAPEPVLALGDLNNDNIIDAATVIAGASAYVVALLPSNGDLNQATILFPGAASNFTYQEIAIKQLNQVDNIFANRDIITLQRDVGGDQLELMFNTGGAVFTNPVQYPLTSSGDTARHMAFGDFNGDGFNDIAISFAAPDNYVRIYLNNGAETSSFIEQAPLTAGIAPDGIAAADLNNDEILDLVVSHSGTSGVEIFLGNSDGSFANGIQQDFGGSNETTGRLAIRDFNNDGIVDVAVSQSGGDNIFVAPGAGDGSLNVGALLTFSAASSPVDVRAADMNGDGIADLVVSNNNQRFSVLTGTNDAGAFNLARQFFISSPITSTEIVDLDHDGDKEIFGINSNTGDLILVFNRLAQSQ